MYALDIADLFAAEVHTSDIEQETYLQKDTLIRLIFLNVILNISLLGIAVEDSTVALGFCNHHDPHTSGLIREDIINFRR